MDITKVKAAVNIVKAEVSALYKAAVVAGEKDPCQLGGLQPLGKANLLLDKVVERVEQAAERSVAKVKEAKSDAKTVADAAAAKGKK